MNNMFADNLKKIMGEKGISQVQLSRMTGIGKSSISMYMAGKVEPAPGRRKEIARALDCDYDELNGQEEEPDEIIVHTDRIARMDVTTAARIMGMNHMTVRKGLQQGVFPWGYAIHTSENRWIYFINAKKFAEMEEVPYEEIHPSAREQADEA